MSGRNATTATQVPTTATQAPTRAPELRLADAMRAPAAAAADNGSTYHTGSPAVLPPYWHDVLGKEAPQRRDVQATMPEVAQRLGYLSNSIAGRVQSLGDMLSNQSEMLKILARSLSDTYDDISNAKTSDEVLIYTSSYLSQSLISRLWYISRYANKTTAYQNKIALNSLKRTARFIVSLDGNLPSVASISPCGNLQIEWYAERIRHVVVQFPNDGPAMFMVRNGELRFSGVANETKLRSLLPLAEMRRWFDAQYA